MNGFTNEAEYLLFKEGLRNVLIKMLIGLCLGIGFGIATMSDAELSSKLVMGLLFGIVFAGIPYAWSKMPFIALGIIGFVVKFMICFCIGWLITLVGLTYNFVMMKKYEKRIVNNSNEIDVIDDNQN